MKQSGGILNVHYSLLLNVIQMHDVVFGNCFPWKTFGKHFEENGVNNG